MTFIERKFWAAGGVALSMLCVACSSDGRAPFRGRSPTAGCVAPRQCDITERECQEAVFEATVCERNQPAAAPPVVRMQSVEDFRSEQRAAAEKNPVPESWEAALRLLRLVPEGKSVLEVAIDQSAAAVAAYYSDETDVVTVLERDQSPDPQADVHVLAHEFVHALQDAEVDLGAFLDANAVSSDSTVAVRTLVEGEATVVSYAVVARSFGVPPQRTDWQLYRDTLANEVVELASGAESPMLAAFQLFPYSAGFSALFEPWLAEGDLSAYYEEPITAFADFLDAAEPGRTVVETLDCYPVDPPPGFTAVDQDSFGVIGALAAVDDFLSFESLEQAWRGDAVVVFRGDAGYAAAWTVRFVPTFGADTFEAAARARIPGARLVRREREVDVLVSDDAETLATWSPGCGTRDALPVSPQASAGTDAPSASRQRSSWRVPRL